MKKLIIFLIAVSGFTIDSIAQKQPIVTLASGKLQGVTENSIYIFKGVPYALPPLGVFRWREPQPMNAWSGIRKADHFGARAMQRPIYKDMRFRSEEISEDCLYLNVWTRSLSPKSKMPVLVYFHGGGLSAGDGSEWRYDGARMASYGVVTVTVNYRLGIFGFMALEELSRESPHHASGNYGFLDQRAALLWVQQNIAAFGGDPARVTIAGQSAGAVSVSAHMASPLSKGLFHYAIGQSGSMLGSLQPVSRKQGETNGSTFSSFAGAHSLAELRDLPAGRLLELTATPGAPSFPPVIDGYFLNTSPREIFNKNKQADVPLLAGWTSAEVSYHYLFGKDSLTITSYRSRLEQLYGDSVDNVLKYYPANDQQQLLLSATQLASDRFTAYGTWKWLDLHAATGKHTAYRYLFAKNLPVDSSAQQTPVFGPPHSADIEYALGNLSLDPLYHWTTADSAVSHLMQSYFINFIRTGNPNGPGLPDWPKLTTNNAKVMVFAEPVQAQEETHRERYLFLNRFYGW